MEVTGDMVEIRRGDLVKTDGTELHIKKSDDGVIWYWAADTDTTHTETFDMFIERAKQAGYIKIVPGGGKYDSPDVTDDRDVYAESV